MPSELMQAPVDVKCFDCLRTIRAGDQAIRTSEWTAGEEQGAGPARMRLVIWSHPECVERGRGKTATHGWLAPAVPKPSAGAKTILNAATVKPDDLADPDVYLLALRSARSHAFQKLGSAVTDAEIDRWGELDDETRALWNRCGKGKPDESETLAALLNAMAECGTERDARTDLAAEGTEDDDCW